MDKILNPFRKEVTCNEAKLSASVWEGPGREDINGGFKPAAFHLGVFKLKISELKTLPNYHRE